jgi:arylsulfatase A-like enzyme
VTDGPPANYIVVVFDALRASDFPGGVDPVPGMPCSEQLRRESFVFPNSVSVTPWTIPAHASLFTGLYPWEHGAHAKKNLVLDASIPKLPDFLRPFGYRSLMLSANTLICPRFGLVSGFDDASWGGWWESYVRRVRQDSPPCSFNEVKREAALLDRFRDGPLGKLAINSTEAFYRFPAFFDSLDRIHQRLRYPEDARDLSVAPWIEPALKSWISRQPRDSPLLIMINLVDTHEPYFTPPGLTRGLSGWWDYAKVRQDFVSCISGEWVPSTEELRVLRELYRCMVRNSDRRLDAIVKVFQEAGRWDRTGLFVTSDHGQAFGEHGELFHLNGVIDPMLRIPLWYRPPGGTGGPVTAKGWASIIDVAPTIVEEVDSGNIGRFPSAVPLMNLVDKTRESPVFAMSDGLVWNHLKNALPGSRRSEFDRIRVVAYRSRWKTILDVTRNEIAAFDLETDPGEDHNLWEGGQIALAPQISASRAIGEQISHSPSIELDKDVADRLRSWGYV